MTTPTPPVESSVFHAVGLQKRYGRDLVLDDVNIGVRRGEVKAIIGPSGSGKSTLLRLIALLEHPDSGSMYLNGRAIGVREQDGRRHAMTERQLARQRQAFGIVFQSFNLFLHLNAVENVMLALRVVKKKDKGAAREKASDMLVRVGLGDRRHAYASELSGGQQQRVAIARALVMEPEVMLFDEPTSALDPELVHEVLSVMESLASEGMTMFVVSHEIGFVRRAADSVAMFDNGRIVEEGTPDRILGDPEHESSRRFLRHIG